MTKVVCTVGKNGFTVGKTYYGRLSSINIRGIEYELFECINDDGWKSVCPISNTIPYNDWIALEREKQIKTILDD